MPIHDIFAVPVLNDKYLLYAPLHALTALVDKHALRQIQHGLYNHCKLVDERVVWLVEALRVDQNALCARTGPLTDPLFLGIIPTRGCNMACRYCDFAAPKKTSSTMDLSLARAAMNAYLDLIYHAAQSHAEIHFFGGEPFYAENVVHFVVGYARMRAAELGISVRFEAITNGLFNTTRCRWIADHFDAIVLSLDGPADIQDHHRPGLSDMPTFERVVRNARLLSESDAELILRVCVTDATVMRMPEIAGWITQELRPSTVCFESLTPSRLSAAAGMRPPDPWCFTRNFLQAARLLKPYGIEAVLSTAELGEPRISFCPVGKDALIVSPEGAVDACYLLEKDWRQKGMDMRLGYLDATHEEYLLDRSALARMRQLNVHHKPLCAKCLCRYHCAGGCHVNHNTNGKPGTFSDLCIQTRLVTIAALLGEIDQDPLLGAWQADRQAQEESVLRISDCLMDASV